MPCSVFSTGGTGVRSDSLGLKCDLPPVAQEARPIREGMISSLAMPVRRLCADTMAVNACSRVARPAGCAEMTCIRRMALKPLASRSENVWALHAFGVQQDRSQKLGLQSVDRFNIAPQSQVVIRTDAGDHTTACWGIPLSGPVRAFCHQRAV